LVKKITVTLDQKTVADLDRWVREGRYSNRSGALQSAVDLLVERQKRSQLTTELGQTRSGRGEAPGRRRVPRPFVAGILKGEIYWADLNPVRGREQAGRRPVLVLSHDIFNRHSGTVIAMAITSQQQTAGFPLTLALPQNQLPKPSWVKISQIEAYFAAYVFMNLLRGL
jgi:mRNA interferase MazF